MIKSSSRKSTFNNDKQRFRVRLSNISQVTDRENSSRQQSRQFKREHHRLLEILPNATNVASNPQFQTNRVLKGSIILGETKSSSILSPPLKTLSKVKTPQLEKVIMPKSSSYKKSLIQQGSNENIRSFRKLKLTKSSFSTILAGDNDHPLMPDRHVSMSSKCLSRIDTDFTSKENLSAVKLDSFVSPVPIKSLTSPPNVKAGMSRPSEEMYKRWQQTLRKGIPAIDLVGASNQTSESHRQFAPEYSQSAYDTMLKKEFAIGNYIGLDSPVKISQKQRRTLIALIEDLHQRKGYKEETLFIAVSIADRYLVNLCIQRKQPPCLTSLAVISLLLGAKLEQPMHPSFNIMIKLLKDTHGVVIEKQVLLQMEKQILQTLEFSMHFVSPVPFLERFQMIYGFERMQPDVNAKQIRELSRKLCRYMQRDEIFLNFRPSQVAAASLLLAVNLSQSNLAETIGLTRQPDVYASKGLSFDTTIRMEVGGEVVSGSRRREALTKIVPLKLWDKAMEELTGLTRMRDIKPIYKDLLVVLSQSETPIGKVITTDPTLSPLPNKVRA